MKAAVKNLANEMLAQDEFGETLWIATNYGQNHPATLKRLFQLDGKIGIPLPTHTHYEIKYRGVIRSIDYYCKTDLRKGIRFTRNFVENASAHVVSSAELLLKKLDSNARTDKPFGQLVEQLERLHVTQDLVNRLRTFNKIVYVRAKHEWGPPLRPRVHLFTKTEAIVIYFIARKLGKQIFDEGKLALPG
jgi:hypothetical protein